MWIFQPINRQLMTGIQRKNKAKGQRRHSAPARSDSFLGHYQQAPQFLKDNEHIKLGYRIGFDSPRKVARSLFMIHNETVNIWLHLLGAIIMIFFIFQGIAYEMEESHILGKTLIYNTVLPYKQESLPQAQMDNLQDICQLLNRDLQEGQEPFQCTAMPTDGQNQTQGQVSQEVVYDDSVPTWPIIMGLLGGSICLSCSAVFHWIHPISEKVYKSALMLDFAGIGINMAFSPIPAFYYASYCNWDIGFLYISINIIAGTVSFISNLFDWTHRKQNTLVRFSILASSSVSCAVALIHIIVNEFYYGNFGDAYSMIPSLYFYVPTLLCYMFGFIFYISRCPERRSPGSYDLCGHSHQIWHVFIFLAIAFNYLGSIASYEVRSVHSTCPSPFLQQYQ